MKLNTVPLVMCIVVSLLALVPGVAQDVPLDPEAAKLKAEREKLDRTLWADEVAAQDHEGAFIRLWDRIRNEDPYAAITATECEQIVLGTWGQPSEADWGIALFSQGEPKQTVSRDEAIKKLHTLRDTGWKIEQAEFHHSTFHPARDGKPARSVVATVVNARHAGLKIRAALKGDIQVVWTGKRDKDGVPIAQTFDLSGLKLMQREGEPMFSVLDVFDPRHDARGAHPRVQPLMVYDLNGDGLSEIVLGGTNYVYVNRGKGSFQRQKLCEHPKDIAECGVLADFTGDGHADFIVVDFDRKLYMFEGDGTSRFSGEAKLLSDIKLELPKVMTAGDIDGDGDLDLFVAQYKPPYQEGQMPTPYYDANDGLPAYLLRNDGNGKFVDITDEAGLSKRRTRRTFSASFVDLNDDDALDLVVVSDFSGLDAFVNDGKGNFSDVTASMFDERHAFGMAHSFGDYDGDGQLDFYMVGMSSTTARRLSRLGLGREDLPDRTEKRGPMTYGNRLYVRRGDRYVHAPFSPEVARMGWAWGVASFDFENDGDTDLYVANGHISGKSSRDYCTRYWTHDIYTGDSKPDPKLRQLFGLEVGPAHDQLISWNGFEKNALLMNAGDQWHNVGYLMGVSFEFDSRAVVAHDLDADGRVDLCVVQNWGTGDKSGTVLHIYRNVAKSDGHWIGVRLHEAKGQPSPIGARITVNTAKGKKIARIVNGDSFSCQHPTTAHFGLGEIDQVESIDVRWPNGKTVRIAKPATDQYHTIR